MSKMNRNVPFKVVLTLLLALVMSLAWGTAMGQDKDKGSGDEFMLEEIVVTAEFREKAIQDTPLSITAVNAETMEARNQVRLEEIAVQSPNVSLRPGNATYGSSLTAFIRGIGQVDFNPSVEAGVGIYVDDVYYSTITGNLLDLLDLDRVEILRGPQGTLAGRNAEGGAIKLFSKKPTGEGDGYISVTAGSFDRLDLKAAADFAVTDTLFVRIAGTSKARDGYITSYDYACKNNLPEPGQPGGLPSLLLGGANKNCELAKEGDESMTAGRLSVRWAPTDVFEANFSMNIVNDKSGSQPSVLYSARNLVTQPPSVPIYFDNNGNGLYDEGIDVPYDDRFVTKGTYYNYSTYMDNGMSTPNPNFQGGTPGENISLYKPSQLPRINTLDAKDYTLALDWNITDNVAVKSITAYREYLNMFADDNDGSPFAVQQLLQTMDHTQWTQELRLNATLFDGFADATIGGFYLDQETIEDARVDINYVGFDFIHGPDKVPAKSKALYGQATLHLTDRMDLTAGLRYSKDEKSYSFQRHNADGSDISPFDPTLATFDLSLIDPTVPPGVVFIPYPFDSHQPANVLLLSTNGQHVSYESDRWDWRIALDYDISDNIMAYAQVATGYRAGGNNARPFYPSQINAFDPEELTNYEVGVKSTLFDMLRLNASAFYNDFTNIQLNVESCYFAPAGEQSPCAAQDNVGDAEVKGFELEGVFRPTPEFMLDFSYAYLDFNYTHILSYVDANGDSRPIAAAETTPYTPKNKLSAGAQYRFDLGKFGSLIVRGDYSWRDDVETVGFVGQGETIKAYDLYNGRVSWQSKDALWQVSLEGTNLADKYYYLTIFDLEDAGGSIFKNAQPGRPQEFAITIKRSWF